MRTEVDIMSEKSHTCGYHISLQTTAIQIFVCSFTGLYLLYFGNCPFLYFDYLNVSSVHIVSLSFY